MPSQLSELNIDLVTRGHLEKGLESLKDEFAGIFSAETIERYMAESVEQLPRRADHELRSALRSSLCARAAPRARPKRGIHLQGDS